MTTTTKTLDGVKYIVAIVHNINDRANALYNIGNHVPGMDIQLGSSILMHFLAPNSK